MGRWTRKELEDQAHVYRLTARKSATTGDWSHWANLFTEDATYVEHKDPRTFLNRPYMSEQQRLRDNFGPVTVPAESYFCMGDNRDMSYDSRFWGTVPAHYVKGRAFLIYWSFGGGTSDGTWRGATAKLRELANTALGFLTKTRWTRSFHLPS